MRMLGIEKLKKVCLQIVKIGIKTEKNLEDGKITLWEWVSYLPLVGILLGLFSKMEDIRAEILDLDDTEKHGLVLYISEELDLENDKIEAMIELGLNKVIETWAFLQGVLQLLKINKIDKSPKQLR